MSRKKAAQNAETSSDSKLPTPPREDDQHPQSQHSVFEPPDEAFWDLVSPMVLPGAGLKDVDSDRIFDSIFGGKPHISSPETQRESTDLEMDYKFSQAPTCRAYNSNEAV